MKIKRLTDAGASPAIADVYIDPDTKKKHFNLVHGIKGADLWKWYAGIDPNYIDTNTDKLVLDQDNYCLTPVMRGGKHMMDKKNNKCYNIATDNNPSHCTDVLLLWNIPSRSYRNISYSISGDVSLIGEGYNGKSTSDRVITAPAPVLEIFGDCEISWSGINNSGAMVKQQIKYHYHTEQWDINPVELKTESNDV